MPGWTRRSGPLAVALILLLAGWRLATAQTTASYETPRTYRAAEALPKELVRGPRWEVLNPVVSDGYMFRVKVRSDYGPFDANGMGALRKLVGEIAPWL